MIISGSTEPIYTLFYPSKVPLLGSDTGYIFYRHAKYFLHAVKTSSFRQYAVKIEIDKRKTNNSRNPKANSNKMSISNTRLRQTDPVNQNARQMPAAQSKINVIPRIDAQVETPNAVILTATGAANVKVLTHVIQPKHLNILFLGLLTQS